MTRSFGHTPGPWKVDGEEIQCSSDDSFICALTGGDEEQDAADRNLIAAAPELLEALKTALEARRLIEAGADFESFPDFGEWLERTNAAIAKAEGRQ